MDYAKYKLEATFWAPRARGLKVHYDVGSPSKDGVTCPLFRLPGCRKLKYNLEEQVNVAADAEHDNPQVQVDEAPPACPPTIPDVVPLQCAAGNVHDVDVQGLDGNDIMPGSPTQDVSRAMHFAVPAPVIKTEPALVDLTNTSPNKTECEDTPRPVKLRKLDAGGHENHAVM